jgi:hypothetical protein
LKSEAVDVESLIEGEFSLSSGIDAMERAAQPGVLKILLRA